jgi:CRP-like cAMP-binding protein
MSIENERLRLTSHRTLVSSDGSLVIERPDGEKIPVPRRFTAFFQAVTNGASLEQIALGFRQSKSQGRFALLSAFLTFLADAGLLADRKAVRMIESLRPDYRWRQSVAFEEVFAFELFKLPGGRPLFAPLVASGAFLAGVIVAIFALLKTFGGRGRPAVDFSVLGEPSVATAAIIVFLAVFAIGRSLRSFIQALCVRLIAGTESRLRLKLDLVSLSLGCDDLSRARASLSLVVAGAGCLLLTAFPFHLAGSFKPEYKPLFVYFSLLLLLADFSPLVRSPLTEWLRTLYNTLDRRAEKRGQGVRRDGGSLESVIRFLHIGMSLAWSAGLFLFLAFPTVQLYRFYRSHLDLNERAAQISVAILGLPLLVMAVSFLDDLRGMISAGDSGDQRRVRAMWRRAAPKLPVDEAIQQGKAPSRADLEKLPLLRQLDLGLRNELLQRARVVELNEGEAACRQGALDRSLFILLSGKLAVAKSQKGRRRRVVAMLEPGSVFGEAAFFFSAPRTADVIAFENSRVLEITHDPAMKTMDGARSSDLQLRIWFLQALVSGSFLRQLPSEALDAVVFAGIKHTVRVGETVIREGEPADGCYFLIQGQASVYQTGKNDGKPINRVKAGDAFGEIALLRTGTVRTASVVAESDLLCVRIDADPFWRLLANHLPLAIEIERLAEARLTADRAREQG